MNLIYTTVKIVVALALVGCSEPQNYDFLNKRQSFMDEAITQAELNEGSCLWVEQLSQHLEGQWDAYDEGLSYAVWLETQCQEIEKEIKDYEGGTVYPLAFNLSLADRLRGKILEM